MITFQNQEGAETQLFEFDGLLELFYPHPRWGGRMVTLGVIGRNGADDTLKYYEVFGGDETDWSVAFSDQELLKFGWPWDESEAEE